MPDFKTLGLLAAEIYGVQIMSSERTSYNQRGHFFGHKDGTAKFLLLWLAAYKERTKRANKIVVTFIRHMLTELVIHYNLSVKKKCHSGWAGCREMMPKENVEI